MQVTHIALKNWLNFRKVETDLAESTYVIGPNAAGKSNFLDVFRFLRTIASPSGGGLLKAVAERGGLKKLRCLQARGDTEIRIRVRAVSGSGEARETWDYTLGFKGEGKGRQRPIVTEEKVRLNGESILQRPDKDDASDPERLTQTHLEQVSANRRFRALAEFFAATTYLHLVPQLLKFSDRIGGNRLEGDPFGQGFLEGLARTPTKTQTARLKKIQQVLEKAVPQFQELRFVRDQTTGLPHLEARYEHWRPHGAWQREDQFSDGTLRLIALFWALLAGDSMLLLEEPELSLNHAIVSRIPSMIDRIKRQAKHRRQVLLTTHSEALLDNPIDGHSVRLVVPTRDGSEIRAPDEQELEMLAAGLSPAEILLPKVQPREAEDLGRFK